MKNRALITILSISAAAPVLITVLYSLRSQPHKPAIAAGLTAAALFASAVFVLLRKKDVSRRLMSASRRASGLFSAFFLETLLCPAALSAGYYVSGSWKGAALASALHISEAELGRVLAVIMAAAAVPAVTALCLLIADLASEIYSGFSKRGKCAALLLLLAVLRHVTLQFSCLRSVSGLFSMKWYMFAIGTAFILALDLMLFALTGRLRASAVVLSAIVSVWSLVNYYVVLYHGSPLFISTLASAGTAAGVLSGYRMTLPAKALSITALFALQMCVSLSLPKALLKKCPEAAPPLKDGASEPAADSSAKTSQTADRLKARPRERLIAAGAALALSGVFLFCVNCPAVKPVNSMGWYWGDGVQEYGYLACNWEDLRNKKRPLTVPEGYSLEAVNDIASGGSAASSEKYPDIIIILNESFYDLSVYTDIEFDRDYLEELYSIEGARCGYACKPRFGTTNNAEMEILTSNSMALLPLEAPFNYFDFTKYSHSLAADLKLSGYGTAGMHVYSTHYSRHIALPLLGFDEVCLGPSYFPTRKAYGNREWTDEGNFTDMEAVYASMGEGPRFVYLLTFQNHSGYDKNDPSFDTVHTLSDFGAYTEKINEYATSAAMSAEAFAELTEYYRGVDRPVIIFMTGDHGPYFLPYIEPKKGFSDVERIIAELTIPYVIWSNCDISWPESASELSFTDVGPLIKQAAGLPLSAYDEIILKLHEKAPFRIPFSYYRDPEGVIREFDLTGDGEVSALMRDYFYAEYNLLKGGEDCRAELFAPGE